MTRELSPRSSDRYVDSADLNPSFITGYLDLAIAGTLDYDAFRDVFLEARRPIPRRNLPRGTRGFLRRVLRRPKLREEELWGEIAVVVSDEVEGDHLLDHPRGDEPRVGLMRAERTVLRHGRPGMVIWSLPASREHAGELRSLAREIGERFVRQID
ncbi:MAG: hypothetical protein ACHQ2Y_01725 [Candidatus Lutacidiplasmatales archaeon]